MRVVLDTNTLISALLFSGTASRLVPLWQSRRITILLSGAILQEYLRVLTYPKFRLNEREVRGLLEEELLPFVETVRATKHLRVVRRDPEDNKFLECTVAGRAEHLVTGDQDLLELETYRGITVLTVGDFLNQLAP
ncbi:putative toxin-antitoxin system toxin component, PIN family [Candidatus Methylomirabilis sp.]|uniref:putative toxin-antitoxin system toxin component, PIN family n=1 Tax=Candidatus Methylomirabilis sp. TaxID=2032687 RepID=UPI00307606B7